MIETANKTTDATTLCSLIEEHRLVREHCPSQLLKSPEVWSSLLKDMPAEALIRNLGLMTSRGLFVEGKTELDHVSFSYSNKCFVEL